MSDLDKLEALARAATPGEWGIDHRGGCITLFAPDPRGGREHVAQVFGERDAPLLAAMHPAAVLELVATIRDLRAERDAFKRDHAAQSKLASKLDDEVVEVHQRREAAQRAYDAIAAALADVEVPIALDKGQPCLDRIAALKAERAGAIDALDDMRDEIMSRFGCDGTTWLEALTAAHEAVSESRALRDAWAAVRVAAGCEDLKPERHGSAIIRYLHEVGGRAAKAFAESRALRCEVADLCQRLDLLAEYFRDWRCVPDAFHVDAEAQLVTIWEVEVSHPLCADKLSDYLDLLWFLDSEYWAMRLISVSKHGLSAEIDLIAWQAGASMTAEIAERMGFCAAPAIDGLPKVTPLVAAPEGA